MGLTLAKCPACGADLNLEIDRDFFYCPSCGSKVLKQDQKIVVEHINRTIDEAKVRKVELEERRRADEKEKEKEQYVVVGRVGKVVTIICIAGFILSYFADQTFSTMIRVFSVELGVMGAIGWAASGIKKR